MGVTDKTINTSLFDDDLKKPDRALKISKKNLFFIIFTVVTLQVADAAILWLFGARTGSNSHFSGDSLLFTGGIFAILKLAYEKYNKKSKVSKEENEPADEEDDCRKAATVVVDTMKVKGPPSSRTQTQTRIQKAIASVTRKMKPRPRGCEATIWVSSWWRPPCLNPRAEKFMPLRTYGASTLDSNSEPFWPQHMVLKEEELLKSNSGGSPVGEVVYRSNHWMTEIGFGNKNKDPSLRTRKPANKKADNRPNPPTKVQKAALLTTQQPQRRWVPKSTTIQS